MLRRASSSSMSSSSTDPHQHHNNNNYHHRRSPSSASAASSSSAAAALEQPILVYHQSARSIVFRDQLRRAAVATTKASKENGFVAAAAAAVSQSVLMVQPPQQVPPPSSTTINPNADPNDAVVTAAAVSSSSPKIVPLAPVELSSHDQFHELLWPVHDDAGGGGTAAATNNNHHHQSTIEVDQLLSPAEREVCTMLREQRCVVKTIKNADWTAFLDRFRPTPPAATIISYQQNGNNKAVSTTTHQSHGHNNPAHTDRAANPPDYPYPSFMTSTSLLPTNGRKMRCFGSTNQYTVGVVFALPAQYDDGVTRTNKEKDKVEEDTAAAASETWAWPAGYSAKTEFNIDSRGRLINGRAEALVSLSTLRQYNNEYVHSDTYTVAQRRVTGLQQIPYNEVFVRVGGLGRLVDGIDVVQSGLPTDDAQMSSQQQQQPPPPRSFVHGLGLPVALFVRSATYGHLLSLLRTRARFMHTISETAFRNIPLLYITPDHGVRVLTESLQRELWKRAANNLTPFQNPSIAHRTTMDNTDEVSFQQKVEELFEIDESIREQLTPEEIGSLAGGFGVTDASVANVLQEAMLQDKKWNRDNRVSSGDGGGGGESHRLQDVVNEGLAAAVRSNDFHTSRQLLLLYSLVASSAEDDFVTEAEPLSCENGCFDFGKEAAAAARSSSHLLSPLKLDVCVDEEKMAKELERIVKRDGTLSDQLRAPPPPPPLDTDRLRSATNSDGLLAVLGAAQVLKAMRNDTAKRRVEEAVTAIDEWVGYGEQSVAFRVASWYDQRASQSDLKIATDNDTKLMAFVSNKAVYNRKKFARQLRDAVDNTDFHDVRFLLAIIEILKEMHSPCLRLELLQYVLGLDNRYSVAHVIRSVELAASCLGIAASARN